MQGQQQLGPDCFASLVSNDADDALWCGAGPGCVSGADAFEKHQVLAFEPVSGTDRGAARSGHGRGQVEPQRQVGLQQPRRDLLNPLFELRQQAEVEAAPTALVGEGGVSETVAQHDLAARLSTVRSLTPRL